MIQETTFIRKDLLPSNKVPTLTQISHVASLKLIVQEAKKGQNIDFKEKIQSLPRNLVQDLFQATFFNSHSCR